MAPLLEKLEDLYGDFLAVDPRQLRDVYAESVIFRDPIHTLRGLPAVEDYFAGMAANLSECRFVFDQTLASADRASLWWTMHYRHPKLAGGKLLSLRGASLLTIDPTVERVLEHEDIYDLGAMVYEQIPVLGAVVNLVKGRLTSGSRRAPMSAATPSRGEERR